MTRPILLPLLQSEMIGMRPIIASFNFFFLTFAVAISTGQTSVGQRLYSLATPGGSLGTAADATGINNHGQVVGRFVSPSESGLDVFFWDPINGDTVISGPAPLPGSVTDNYSVGISDSGLVAGTFRHFDLGSGLDTHLRPFTWTSESGTSIFTGSPISADGRVFLSGFFIDLNNTGTVVGGGGFWVNGVVTPFDSIFNDDLDIISVLAINDLDQVVGQNENTAGRNAFIWDATSGLEIIDTPFREPQLVFEDDVVPGQLNNKGQVVGLWCRYIGPLEVPDLLTDDLFERTAFFWSDGQITDLGTLPGMSHSDANAINEDSTTVGWSADTGSSFDARRAVVWDSEQAIIDLNNLLDETGDGWTLLEAHDINDAGQIVGSGINPAGVARAFLLTPVSVLGDCNQDGVLNFSDIASFISILIAGDYLAAADINEDGVVDFSDIPLFIEILQGT